MPLAALRPRDAAADTSATWRTPAEPLTVELDGVRVQASDLGLTGCTVQTETPMAAGGVHYLTFIVCDALSVTVPSVVDGRARSAQRGRSHTVRFNFMQGAADIAEAVAVLVHSVGSPTTLH